MSSNTKINNLEQKRAAYAYSCAEAGANLGKNKEYKSYVKKMPMLIKTNGVLAALSFAFAKGLKNGKPNTEDPWGMFYAQLEKWVIEKRLLKIENSNLVRELSKESSSIHRIITVEIFALLLWLKRFADALIEGEATEP